MDITTWDLAKLTTAPLTPEQMGEYASASTSKPPSPAEQQRQLKEEIRKALKFDYQ